MLTPPLIISQAFNLARVEKGSREEKVSKERRG
jgi:hypothetical protein